MQYVAEFARCTLSFSDNAQVDVCSCNCESVELFPILTRNGVIGSQLTNADLSNVICAVAPESMYHDWLREAHWLEARPASPFDIMQT